jgi:hypothetical protein
MTIYIECPKCKSEAYLWSDDIEESYYICNNCERYALGKSNGTKEDSNVVG